MNIQFCEPARILERREAGDVLREIARTASAVDVVPLDEEDLLRRLREREDVASTAIGHGVAIPHCMVDSMDTIVVGLVAARPAVSFEEPDGEPVDLFFFIVSPSNARTVHLQVLAAISRAVRDESFRQGLRNAGTDRDLTELLKTRLSLPEHQHEQKPCRFRVLFQDPELLQDVIEDLSAFGAGSMVVFEGENVASYLGNLPIFAGLWSPREDTSIHVLEGIIHRDRANELARRVSDRAGHSSGILVTVEELLVAHGGLET